MRDSWILSIVAALSACSSPPGRPLGVGLSSLSVADMNGDGKPDLVGLTSDGQVGVLLGEGAGAFAPLAKFPLGPTPGGLSVADYDGDGHLDVGSVTGCGASPCSLSVARGNGNGTLQTPMVSSTDGGCNGSNFAGQTLSAAVALGGDTGAALIYTGFPSPTVDVAAAFSDDAGFESISCEPTAPGVIESSNVSKSLGLAGFPPEVSVQAFAVADFDGDGRLDAAFAGGTSFDVPTLITLLTNVTGGAFHAQLAALTPPGPWLGGLAAGDLDGDGKPDLVALDSVGAALYPLLNRGPDHFELQKASPVGSARNGIEETCTVLLADFDGDGKLDAVAVLPEREASFLRGNGDGTFQNGASIGVLLEAAVAADFTGDGKIDLAGSTSNGLLLLTGKGDGTFE